MVCHSLSSKCSNLIHRRGSLVHQGPASKLWDTSLLMLPVPRDTWLKKSTTWVMITRAWLTAVREVLATDTGA